MKFTVRPINTSDYLEIIDVIKRSARETKDSDISNKLSNAFEKKYSLENFRRKAQEITYFVAAENKTGKLAGIIGIKENALRTLYVDPNYQGMGAGRQLYDAFETEAKKRGLTEVMVESSTMAEPIYQHFGFVKVREIIKEIDGIQYNNTLMEKSLN